MSIPTTPLLRKNSFWKTVFLVGCLSLMSLYPIYKNFYNGRAITTYERHMALIEGRSEYYNPWQYRMLCPLMIEGMMWVYDNTIDRVYPLDGRFNIAIDKTSEQTTETREFIQLVNTPGALKYMIVFIAFRFLLNTLVFYLAIKLWRYFVKNDWLIFFGLMFLSLAMGNAVVASDLTFNTYLDNVFYLVAACIIVYRRNPYWIIPVTALAAFNRETSMLIPFLFFVSRMDFTQFSFKRFNLGKIVWPKRKTWVITGVSYAIFFAIFIAVRSHFGYQPQQVWKVDAGLPMIKLNLLSGVAAKSYFEMLGVFSVIPLLLLYRFKRFPLQMRVWFLALVPAWFAVHIYSVVIYQTRLFLVPIILVMIPMLLWMIHHRSQMTQGESRVGVSG